MEDGSSSTKGGAGGTTAVTEAGPASVSTAQGRWRVTRLAVAKRPLHVVLPPLLLLCIVIPVGVWAVLAGASNYVSEAKYAARVTASQTAALLKGNLDADSAVLMSMALMIQSNPRWDAVSTTFKQVAAKLMAPTREWALFTAPLGVLEDLQPAALATNANGSSSIAGLDLMPMISIPVNASDTSELIQFTSLFPLPSGILGDARVMAVFIVPPNGSTLAGMMGYNRSTPLECPACVDAASGRQFWGFVGNWAPVSLTFLSPDDVAAVQLRNAGFLYRFAFVFPSSVPGEDPMEVESGVTDPGPTDAVCFPFTLVSLGTATLCVSPQSGWGPAWKWPLIAATIVMAMVLACLLLSLQVSRYTNLDVLQAVIPREVLQDITEGRAMLKELQISAACGPRMVPADTILFVIDEFVSGRLPAPADLLMIRTTIARRRDIYAADDLQRRLAASHLDADVTNALLAQLGGQAASLRLADGATNYEDILVGLDSDTENEEPDSEAPRHETLREALVAILTTPGQGQPRSGSSTRDSASLSSTASQPELGSAKPTLVHKSASSARDALGPGTSQDLQGLALVPEAAALAFPSPAAPLIEEVERMLASADTCWMFDSLKFNALTQNQPLSTMAYFLLHTSGLKAKFRLPGAVLARFLRAVESGYRNNPYHNAAHAADVLQSLHVILTKGCLVPNYADPLTLLGCYLAAVVHDYEHVGLTNDFLISSSHPIALRYNDRNVLENHHLAAAFQLMRQPGLAILAHLSKAEQDKLRKLVIELVMATDMRQHFSIISQLNAAHPAKNEAICASTEPAPAFDPADRKSRSSSRVAEAVCIPSNSSKLPSPTDEAERMLALQVALKCADLGHLSESLEVHLLWVARLEAEFFLQGDREKELGMPVSPLFDRSLPGVTKSQVGFLDFCVKPLFSAFCRAFPACSPILEAVNANYEYWKEQVPLPRAA